MSRIIVSLVLVILGWSVVSATTDTLRYHNPLSKLVYYHRDDIALQAARFVLQRPGSVMGVKVTLGGPSADGRAVVHLYGHEGGLSAPLLERDLMQAVTIRKTHPGVETIEVLLPQPVMLANNQFFVALDHIDSGVTLLSDRAPKLPSCASSTDNFYYQFIRYSGGRWEWGTYAYAIDVIVEYMNSNRAAKGFINVTGEMGIADSLLHNRSMAWGDFDGDGYQDFMVDGHLYHNDQGKGFSDITAASGIVGSPQANLFIDIDNDRRQDILFLGTGNRERGNSALFINRGDGRFSPTPLKIPALAKPTACAIADVDGNGYLDVFIGQGDAAHPAGNLLLVNDGHLGFIDKTSWIYGEKPLQGECSGAQWVDYNNDGRLDLFVSRGAGCSELWKNVADSVYIDVATRTLVTYPASECVNGSGADWRDYNNDGNVDLLLPVTSDARALVRTGSSHTTAIYLNSGAPDYILSSSASAAVEYEEQHAAGIWGDADNDSHQDFLTTTACPCRFLDLYTQTPDHRFELKTAEYGISSLAGGGDAVWVDFDNDGKLDIATFDDGRFRLLRNTVQSGNNYIELDLGQTDAAALGSTVTVYCQGIVYTRQMTSGRGALMQPPSRLHFGLEGRSTVDSIVVQRTHGGAPESFGPFAANDLYLLRPRSDAGSQQQAAVTALHAFPNPFTTELSIAYTLRADDHVLLQIFSVDGKLVHVLIDADMKAGEHTVTWKALDDQGKRLPPTTYIYSLKTTTDDLTGRAVLVH